MYNPHTNHLLQSNVPCFFHKIPEKLTHALDNNQAEGHSMLNIYVSKLVRSARNNLFLPDKAQIKNKSFSTSKHDTV